MDLDRLSTERIHPASFGIHERSAFEIVRLINAEGRKVAEAVATQLESIAQIVEMAAERLACGGRLFYVGAGTSGRLGVLDAAECPPTFGVPPEMVQGVMAGGEKALVRSVEGAEDDLVAGGRELQRRGCKPSDLVIGISASGRTPFVIGALRWARAHQIATAAISCNQPAEHDAWADVSVNVVVEPEVVAGSTRMKAGTAQKMILNMISTATMIRLGRVRDGRMVEVRVTNEKLRHRATRIVMDTAGVTRERAEAALLQTGHNVQAALELLSRQ
ncbi:MAG: N-acetylmuramic acid 6-phosphate etherase [Candidatus Zipacnadales bacterium]